MSVDRSGGRKDSEVITHEKKLFSPRNKNTYLVGLTKTSVACARNNNTDVIWDPSNKNMFHSLIKMKLTDELSIRKTAYILKMNSSIIRIGPGDN